MLTQGKAYGGRKGPAPPPGGGGAGGVMVLYVCADDWAVRRWVGGVCRCVWGEGGHPYVKVRLCWCEGAPVWKGMWMTREGYMRSGNQHDLDCDGSCEGWTYRLLLLYTAEKSWRKSLPKWRALPVSYFIRPVPLTPLSESLEKSSWGAAKLSKLVTKILSAELKTISAVFLLGTLGRRGEESLQFFLQKIQIRLSFGIWGGFCSHANNVVWKLSPSMCTVVELLISNDSSNPGSSLLHNIKRY